MQLTVIQPTTFATVPSPYAHLITVVSIRGIKPTQAPANLIYIGRYHRAGWPQSPLHNPIKLTDEAQRDMVLQKFRRYLWAHMQNGTPAIVGELARIASLVRSGQAVQLGCWCSPLGCHGDIVKDAVLWWIKEHV